MCSAVCMSAAALTTACLSDQALKIGYSFFHQILTECLGIVWGAGDKITEQTSQNPVPARVYILTGEDSIIRKNKSDSMLLRVLLPGLSHVCSAPFVKERGPHPEMYRIAYSQGSDP